jgi:hypothetical protein
MANVIILAGDSGTGKSTAMEGLDSDTTGIINVLGKDLPFKGSRSMYNKSKKNIISVHKSTDIINYMNLMVQGGCKTIILDDLGFSMQNEFFEKANVTGFTKFSVMGQNMQKIIMSAQMLPADVDVFLVFHEDTDGSEGTTKRKLKLIGRMLDDKYNPLATVTIALFTDVSFDSKDGVPNYGFITNRTVLNGEIVPAKSPKGMFSELKIPNDLALVKKAIMEYYG